MSDDRSIIKPNMIMTDRHGVEWRRAPEYQETHPQAPGFLLLIAPDGTTMHFRDVVDRYGTIGGAPGAGRPLEPVLIVRLEES